MVSLSRGYLPTALMEISILPIATHKSGNLSDRNKYRPITEATTISKILESVQL